MEAYAIEDTDQPVSNMPRPGAITWRVTRPGLAFQYGVRQGTGRFLGCWSLPGPGSNPFAAAVAHVWHRRYAKNSRFAAS